jgi:hypothetical protein
MASWQLPLVNAWSFPIRSENIVGVRGRKENILSKWLVETRIVKDDIRRHSAFIQKKQLKTNYLELFKK